MGIDLDQLAANTATVIVEYRGMSAEVVFRPDALTTEMIEAVDGSDDPNVIFGAMSNVLASWDFTLGGKQLSTSVEDMRKVPITLLQRVFKSLVEATQMGEAETPSNGG
jgi:hypothetical protein